MSTNVTRPEETALFLADRCAELEAENAKLRDQLRWRKWPDESPDSWRHYMVMADSLWPVIAFYTGEYFRIHSEIVVGVTNWRPIGPLP